ncbi:hypothetical protein BH24ACI3_BH24ACI3_09960 [soil metagenome]
MHWMAETGSAASIIMKRSWLTSILLGGVLLLLTLFLGWQYNWLQQAGQAEKERLQKRIETDTKALADEFNREIQAAYLNFQVSAADLQKPVPTEFTERYDFWKKNTAYPELIRDIIYLPNDAKAAPVRFNPDVQIFEPFEVSAEVANIRERTVGRIQNPVLEDPLTLLVPIRETVKRIDQIRIGGRGETINIRGPEGLVDEPLGHIAILLDRETVLGRMLPDLQQKYFPTGEFKLAIKDRSGNAVVGGGSDVKPDATADLMSLLPDNLIFFATPGQALPKMMAERRSGTIVNSRIESRTFSSNVNSDVREDKAITFEINPGQNERPRTQVMSTTTTGTEAWNLAATHRAGSIDAFVSGETRKSMAIGLAIYLLLAGSIAAIVLSAMRSRKFAQRQIDFVSSVSHEFRTPLAVIYSAGENLADGVTKETEQIELYGQLIKGEGRKLSSMVEQILAFAGANSGRKRYRFENADVGKVIGEAVEASLPLLNERGFMTETDVGSGLPSVNADTEALSSAINNLIQNAIKYSDENRWLRVAASNGGGSVKITVEDKGIGIGKRDLRQIFEPFYRVKQVVDAQINGSGLGLSLVKEIAEAHGGTVRAESEVGKGSKFTIELPAQEV